MGTVQRDVSRKKKTVRGWGGVEGESLVSPSLPSYFFPFSDLAPQSTIRTPGTGYVYRGYCFYFILIYIVFVQCSDD